MKLRNKEEREKLKEKEREEKEKIKEKEKYERIKREEKIRREREEKERQKQLEKENKIKLKEEKEKQKKKEREEKEKDKKREKEEKEQEKQRLKEERKRYNETFQNSSVKLRKNIGRIFIKPNNKNINKIIEKEVKQGTFNKRKAYNSSKLYKIKRKNSHKRIYPRNRIPRIEPKQNFGKTTLKILKPKRYEEDESESEIDDFEYKLMKFPKFKAKYGSKYKFPNYKEMEFKIERKKTNNILTISEVDEEEEEKNNKNKNNKKGKLSEVKPKGRMNKKMREILGKQFKLLADDPLNPYGTFWPSHFLKAGYDTGFEYEDFQSGVPVLKLKNLGKKQLPPIKKKALNTTKIDTSVYSPNRNTGIYPGSSFKKSHEETWDIKTIKSDQIKMNNIKFNRKEDNTKKINCITENNDN